MAIRIDHVDDVAVVKLEGSFRGGKETDELQAILMNLITEEGRRTVVDMSRVELMTSFAIGVVIVAHAQAEKLGIDLVLCGIRRRIESVLQITSRFGPRLRILESREEALEALEVV